MKSKFLKLQTPCDEKWENKAPNKTGANFVIIEAQR